MIIVISGTNYRKCAENAFNMACNKKTGSFGRGVINTKDDPRKVERSGRIGEQAYAIYMDKEVDWSYRPKGDTKDFDLGNFAVDVKTSSYNPRKKTDRALIKYIDAQYGKVNLKSDIFVACEITHEDIDNEVAQVEIHGWLSQSEVHNLPRKPGIYGYLKREGRGWMNAVMYFDKLHPIEDLKLIQDILEEN